MVTMIRWIVGCVALAWSAGAVEMSVDFNDLAITSLYGKTGGGTGLIGAWGDVNTSVIKVTGQQLTAPASTGYNVEQPGSVRAVWGDHASADRRLSCQITSVNGEANVIWFSFLIQNQKDTDAAGIDFSTNTGNIPITDTTAVFLVGQTLHVAGPGGGTVDVSSKTTLGQTALVVGSLTLGTASDPESIKVWVNPSVDLLGSTPPDFSSADLQWDISELVRLGVVSHDAGATGTGGYLDLIRISNEPSARQFVTGARLKLGLWIIR